MKISEHANTSLRPLIDAYIQCASPGRVCEGEACFPRSLKRHPAHPMHFAGVPNRGDLICFHVGLAVISYYECLTPETDGTDEDLNAVLDNLDALAEAGIDSLLKVGNDAIGWVLMTPDQHQKMLAEEATKKKGKKKDEVSSTP